MQQVAWCFIRIPGHPECGAHSMKMPGKVHRKSAAARSGQRIFYLILPIVFLSCSVAVHLIGPVSQFIGATGVIGVLPVFTASYSCIPVFIKGSLVVMPWPDY